MKKCPKCGTILDDSKVKCYVCGTDLQRQTLTYGDSFNENIGATVSNNQGNVLGNNVAMSGNNMNQVNGSYSSSSSYSNSLYNNQLNNLNSIAYDDRTALEKMFSSDDRFKSKAELNAEMAMKNNQKRNSFAAALENSLNSSNFPSKNNKNDSFNPHNMNPNMNNSINNNNINNTQQMNVMPGNRQMPNNQNMMNQGMMNQGMMNQGMQQGPMNSQNQQQMFAQRMMQRKKDNQKGPGLKDKLLGKVKGIKDSLDKKGNQKGSKNQNNKNNSNVIQNTNFQNNNMQISNTQNIFFNNKTQDNKQKNNKKQDKQKSVTDKDAKPPINWGNDLVKENEKDKFLPKGIKFNMIFNIIALVISIVGVLFVYFKFIRNDDVGRVTTLNGLRYSIANNFMLKDEKSNYRLYTYGEACSIGISYGATNAVSTYVDDLYENIKKDFDSQNYKVSKTSTKYNDNVWTEINVVVLANNVSSASGYTTQTKIQYVAIVYEGNYYTIGYQNTNNNTVCSASYDSFLKSLAFK